MIDLSVVEWRKSGRDRWLSYACQYVELEVHSDAGWRWVARVYGSDGDTIATYWTEQALDSRCAAKQAAIDFVRDRLAAELIAGMEPLRRQVADIEQVIQELGVVN